MSVLLIVLNNLKSEYDLKIEQLNFSIRNEKKFYLKNSIDRTIFEIESEKSFLLDTLNVKIDLVMESLKHLVLEHPNALENLNVFLKNQFIHPIKAVVKNTRDNKIIYHSRNGEDSNIPLKIIKDKKIDKYKISLFIAKSDFDDLIKKRIKYRLRNILLPDDGYIWINQVINYEGGERYAFRFVHPNLPQTEGSYLSTSTKDIKGNLPYLEELEGVKKDGEVFIEYYFKKKNQEKIGHKMSFAKLYKEYNWIIATGVYLDDVNELVKKESQRMEKSYSSQITKIIIVIVFGLLLAFFILVFFEKQILKLLKLHETEVDNYTQELIREKEKSQQAYQAKSNFLATMSHEVRNPLTSIMGFGQMILANTQDSQVADYADIIIKSSNNVLILLNDLLDVSKIESGLMELEPVKMNVFKFFNEIQQLFQLQFLERSLEMIIQIDDDFAECILMDENRLRQVLINLIGNSLKFTEKGGIKLKASIVSSSIDEINFMIIVEDTGIGIKEEHLVNIFKSFGQVPGQNKKYGGTGLGLTICKTLIEMMGGAIKVDSKYGKGTRFELFLTTSKCVSENCEK